jgi:hypothetical protein
LPDTSRSHSGCAKQAASLFDIQAICLSYESAKARFKASSRELEPVMHFEPDANSAPTLEASSKLAGGEARDEPAGRNVPCVA